MLIAGIILLVLALPVGWLITRSIEVRDHEGTRVESNSVRFVAATIGAILFFTGLGFTLGATVHSGTKPAAASSGLVARFSTSESGLTATFDARQSTGHIKTYSWTFSTYAKNGADKKLASTPPTAKTAATYKFPKAGAYDVRLVVSDGKHSDTFEQRVDVTNPPLPYTQQAASNCKAGFNVKFDPNQNLNDVSKGIDTSNPSKARNEILNVAKHDPRYLFKLVEASPLGKDRFPQLKNYKQLQEPKSGYGCYSDLGRDAFNTYQGVLYDTKTKLASGKAPTVGSNSGTHPNGSPFMEPPGKLTGDPRAVKITYPGGQVVYVLHRCGNVFVPGKQVVPNVPVQKRPPTSPPGRPGHPTPPTSPPSPPHKVCTFLHKPSIPVPPSGLCPKDPDADPQARGNVPSQYVNNTPPADNKSEIDRGPVKPTDSGNGIPSGATTGPSAPRSTPKPAPTHVSGTATLPPPTHSPAPPPTTAPQTTKISTPPPPPGG